MQLARHFTEKTFQAETQLKRYANPPSWLARSPCHMGTFWETKNWSLTKINIKHQSRLKWHFGHTTWSRFQTDKSTTLNRHLIQNYVKFQCSVFIFLKKGLQAFVLTKFPLPLFNTLSCRYLTFAITISNDSSAFTS